MTNRDSMILRSERRASRQPRGSAAASSGLTSVPLFGLCVRAFVSNDVARATRAVNEVSGFHNSRAHRASNEQRSCGTIAGHPLAAYRSVARFLTRYRHAWPIPDSRVR
jgi:hypothetical protein